MEPLIRGAEIVKTSDCRKLFRKAKELIRDEKDAPVLAAALYSKPYALITGDEDFYRLKEKTGLRVTRARKFIESL